MSLARTTAQTKAMLNTTCAMMIECRPSVNLSKVKNESSAIARTMSGMIIGANNSASRAGEGLARSTPNASRVPIVVASVVETSATTKEFQAAACIFGLASILPYHSVEKPPHAVGSPALLKDSTINTTMGT